MGDEIVARAFIPRDRLQAVADLAPKPDPKRNGHRHTGGGYSHRLKVGEYLQESGIGFTVVNSDKATKYILDECLFDSNHKKPDSGIFQYANGMTIYHCSHNSCHDSRKWEDVKKLLGDPKPHHYDPPKPDHAERHRDWKGQQQGQAPPDSSTREARRKRLAFIDCETLDKSDFTTEYHVKGVLAVMQQAILSGGFKTMKTTTAIDLALSVSAGLPFLGKFFTNKCKVGFYCGESGRATTQETARRIAKSKKMPLANFGVHWSFELPQLSNPEDLEIVEEDIKRLGLELAILDPAYLCMGLADNAAGNLFSVGTKLLPLTELQESTGCTIALCHHNKRGVINPFDPPELSDIAWSGFAEWARQWVLLGRRCKYDAEIGGHHELWMNYGGSAGHSGLWALNIEEGRPEADGGRIWDVEVVAASSARADAARDQQEQKQSQREMEQEVRREKDRETILAKMKAFGEMGETKSVIRDLSGIDSKRFNPVFAELIEEKIIETVSVLKSNKQHYEGYKLATRSHSESLG